MSSLRKWRFPILIGSGLIAAGILFYFSSSHVSSDKTQGAIGKRDVYRDGQVASADVATPGSAPVATQAILESSEFKSLAKNPAFQQLVHDDAFNELTRENSAFVGLLALTDFRMAVHDLRFAALVHSATFQLALKNHEDLTVALRTDLNYRALAENASMKAMFASDNFRAAAADKLFLGLVDKAYFSQALADKSFALMALQPNFMAALRDGSMDRLAFGLRR
jgi:hypothetical protein